MNIVYALHRPDGEIRYIGVTSNRGARWRKHRSLAATRSTFPVHCWMRKYGDVEMTVVETCETYDKALAKEVEWIAKLRDSGRLLNCTDGGTGTIGVVRDEQWRIRQSAAQKGNTNARFGKGKTMSPEARAKISAAAKGGAHARLRWHVKRGVVKDGCRHCENVVPSENVPMDREETPAMLVSDTTR